MLERPGHAPLRTRHAFREFAGCLLRFVPGAQPVLELCVGGNEAILVIHIAADTLPPERCAEYAIEHVALNEQVSVGEPRGQFLHEPATLVRHRQRIEVQDFFEQLSVSRIGVADLLQGAQVLADLLMPVPPWPFAQPFGSIHTLKRNSKDCSSTIDDTGTWPK